jgi:hypothetical protein
MALIIEDGTVVVGANSFVTLAEARAYTSDRGIDLPVDGVEVEQALVKAGDYLLSLEQKFKGERLTSAQSMVYPRMGATLFGDYVASDTIPQQVKDAQIVLASYAADGLDLRPIGAGRETRREEVGPIKTEYFEGGRSSVSPIFNAALDILKPLMADVSGNFFPVYRA